MTYLDLLGPSAMMRGVARKYPDIADAGLGICTFVRAWPPSRVGHSLPR